MAEVTLPKTGSGFHLSRADGIMLICALLYGSSFPFAKPLLPHLDAVFYSSTRYLLAAALLFAILLVTRQGLLGRAMLWPRLLACALLFAVFQASWSVALSLTNASVGAVFVATSPLFGALLAHFSGHRLKPSGWIGIAIAFAGVFCVINNSFTGITIAFGSLAADGLWLLVAFMWALFVARSIPLVMTLGPTRSFAWIMMLAGLVLLPVGLWRGSMDAVLAMPAVLWVNFVYTAFFPGAIASLLWNLGLRRLGVTRTMIYMYLVPVFAILIAVVFLGEHFALAQAVGTMAVLGGVAITRRAAG